MSSYAQLVRDGLELQAIKLDASIDPMIAARREQMEKICSANNGNGLRNDALPSNGLHFINVLGMKVDDSDADPIEVARREQMERICSANK